MSNLCIANLKNGQPCKYKKKIGEYCRVHSKMASITNETQELPPKEIIPTPIPKKIAKKK